MNEILEQEYCCIEEEESVDIFLSLQSPEDVEISKIFNFSQYCRY